jgi:hypothetical protein
MVTTRTVVLVAVAAQVAVALLLAALGCLGKAITAVPQVVLLIAPVQAAVVLGALVATAAGPQLI